MAKAKATADWVAEIGRFKIPADQKRLRLISVLGIPAVLRYEAEIGHRLFEGE